MHKFRVIISADAYLPDLTEGGMPGPEARQRVLQDIVDMVNTSRSMDIAQISIFTADQYTNISAVNDDAQ